MASPEWKVLTVDDDPEMHEGLEGILSSRMGDERFAFTRATTFDEGMELIKNNRFDLIFLDVHEDNSDPDPSANPNQEDQRGEQLLDALKSSRFVPVIFYTGFPAKVDHLKSHVVKIVDKGATPQEVRTAVTSILKTGLPQLSQYIEEQSRAYIWESLESVLKSVNTDVTSDIALLAARNLAKNLSQRSIKELLGADTNHIAPLEMYLYPPEKGSCNPADIYRNKQDNSLWMVLTPACDFEQDKAQNVLMAQVTPLVEHEFYRDWQNKARALANLPPQQQQTKDAKKPSADARGIVKSLVKNRQGSRFRFLPGAFFLPDCIVDFQSLLNLPIVESDNYEIVCSLDNPYREEFLQLFSSYYGRIGTPDYELDPIWDRVDKAFTV